MSQNKVYEGQNAERILDHPTFKTAVETLENEYIRMWKATTGDNASEREACFFAIRMLGEVVGSLQSIVNDGKMESDRLTFNDNLEQEQVWTKRRAKTRR